MKLCCTHIMAPGNTFTEKAEVLKKCGFDAISLFEDLDSWTAEKERELFALKGRTGIEVVEFCFSGENYGKLMHEEPAIAEKSKDIYRRAIDICNRLGAVSEMEYSYAPVSPLPLFDPYKKMNAAQKERFLSVFSELASRVDGDAYLLLEPINRYESPYLNNMDDNLAIVEELNLPRTGVLADVFHLSIEEADVPAALRRGGRWIHHVHLGDNNRLLPGNGNLNWRAIFSTLEEIGYQRSVNLECGFATEDHERELADQAGFLRSFLAKP